MAGLPDVDNAGTYGIVSENYVVGVVDPETDEDFAARNVYVANVAAMTQTIWRAMRSFVGPTSGQTLLAEPLGGFQHAAVWGATPNVKPVATLVSAGVVDFGWPTQVTDALGVLHTLSFTAAAGAVDTTSDLLGSPEWGRVKALVTAPNKVRVYTYNSTLAATHLTGRTVTVWVR